MTTRFPFGQVVTRLEPLMVADAHHPGHAHADWSQVTRTDIPGCVVYPAGSTGDETSQLGRPELATQTMNVLLPPGFTLNPTDRVEWRGRVFQVIGFTTEFVSPFTGWAPGNQAVIRLREG